MLRRFEWLLHESSVRVGPDRHYDAQIVISGLADGRDSFDHSQRELGFALFEPVLGP